MMIPPTTPIINGVEDIKGDEKNAVVETFSVEPFDFVCRRVATVEEKEEEEEEGGFVSEAIVVVAADAIVVIDTNDSVAVVVVIDLAVDFVVVSALFDELVEVRDIDKVD